eukprot:5383025-Amphidinium_carterae.1
MNRTELQLWYPRAHQSAPPWQCSTQQKNPKTTFPAIGLAQCHPRLESEFFVAPMPHVMLQCWQL